MMESSTSMPLVDTPSDSPEGQYHIDINPTIYSAIVYAPAISRVKTGEGYFNKATFMVCSMIALNVILQMGLLRLMDIYGHRSSQGLQAIAVQSETYVKTYESFLAPVEKDVVGEMDERRDPLCMRSSNGTYTCMPPSVRFATEWDSLDTDGDGIWSISEAMFTKKGKHHHHHKDKSQKASTEDKDKRSMLQDDDLDEDEHEEHEHEDDKEVAEAKRRTVFFNGIIRGLKKRAEWMEQMNSSFYLSQDVLETRAIPKAYYEFWKGDAMLCTRFNADSCENIVASGLFDAALTHGKKAAAHKGIFDYNSATQYCRMMLEEHGGCEQSFPASYKSGVLDRKAMCGEVSLRNAGTLTNPHHPEEVMVIIKPSYKQLDQQKQASHPTFLFFTCLIMFLFYSSLVDEIRDLIKTTDFLICFPGVYTTEDHGGVDRGEDCPKGQKRYTIQRISIKHRTVLSIVVFLRTCIVIMLITFGTWFLLTEKSYLELVMNAVALSFITGIDEMIYEVFMESAEKEDIGFDYCERLTFKGYIPRDDGSLAGFAFRKDVWGLFLLPVISVVVVMASYYSMRQPVVTALTCACTQEGSNCAEALVNQAAWWKDYWTHTLPAAIHQIDAMRLQGM